jgi:hypothetical protein
MTFTYYRRGLKYVCNSVMCPLSDRKRQKFVLFDIEHPYTCKVGQLVKLKQKKN